MRRDMNVEAKSADFTVTPEDSGKLFIITGTDIDCTLPSVETGLVYHFVIETPSSSVGFEIDPAAADNINRGTDGVTLKNTAATDAIGDAISIVGDAAGEGWLTFGKIGTWAAGS